MSRSRYTSLDDIRNEKVEEKKHVKDDMQRLQNDITDYFMFLQSSSKYMNYIGYAITAYKTAMTFRGVFRFFSKWL